MAEGKGISRRELIKRADIGAGGLTVAGVAAAGLGCPEGRKGGRRAGSASEPLTGPASGFGEPVPSGLGVARKKLANGLTIGGTACAVNVVDEDGRVDPERLGAGAQDLIGSGMDLMLTTSTPEVVNPVSDACEAAGMPCISAVVPWRPGTSAAARTGQALTVQVHLPLLLRRPELLRHLHPCLAAGAEQQGRRRDVAERCRRQRDPHLPRPAAGEGGYTIVDPGAYQDGTTDYTAQITEFSRRGSRSSTRSRSRPSSRPSGARPPSRA